jgi:single-strand DNA-binding protein
MGRLTKDPEIRYTNSAKTVGSFSIAVDRRFKSEGQPDADFFTCVTFGKQAEFVEKYLKKGTKILLGGQLQNNNYEKDGVKHYSIQILVDEIEFAESKKSQQTETASGSSEDFMAIPEDAGDDLPFK